MRSVTDEPHRNMRTSAPLLLALASLLAGGCASTSNGQQEVRIPTVQAASGAEDRVKQVFVYQGRVANDLLERYQFAEGPDAEMDPVLSAAESRMTIACSYLNQAAVSYLAGHEPSWRLKMHVYASVDTCAAAADDVAALLDQQSQPVTISDNMR